MRNRFKNTLYYFTHWEDWHWLVKYIPILPFWFWHCLRSRSLWFFTSSNPSLFFGGFFGTSKREMYGLLPKHLWPKSAFIDPSLSFEKADVIRQNSQLAFPFAVKPEVGMMGFMFRKVENINQFRQYHQAMQVTYIIQEYVNLPLEVSVFYYRFPNEIKGAITGFLKKEFLEVVGNGYSTLKELIASYPRVMFRQEEMQSKHHHKLMEVIPKGEKYCLSYALNLSRGGKLLSLADQKDDKLLEVFDQISHYNKAFFYGRYDIKCQSIEDLKEGKNFSILEYNGSGAEAHHVYGDGNTLIQAQRILVQHWNILSKVSRINFRSGIRRWSFNKGLTHLKKSTEYFRHLSALDASFDFEDTEFS